MAPKGRAFRNVVSLDRYPRVGKDGEISYPLLGYEFCIPAKDWLIKMHPGTSERYGFVRKQGSAQMMRLHPKHSTSSDMHYWAIFVRHPRGYNDTLVYARVSMWALNLLIEGTEVWRMTEVEFSRKVICHHHQYIRVFWKGERIKVADDRNRTQLGGMLRDAHTALHRL